MGVDAFAAAAVGDDTVVVEIVWPDMIDVAGDAVVVDFAAIAADAAALARRGTFRPFPFLLL